ncbi:hypothetical protein [Novosphingobium sp. KN65.2]|uniref:hypothetical protein n=1 Tax=Novosphingobium sp. KN65.2 TaxID=1478134 RepID=UPI000B08EC35|nr:hypothetical protein [Novosphingobium sp. KN65.2]
MKRWIVLFALMAVASCNKPVNVPTETQFEADPKLLADWMQKCTKGEYSNIGMDEHFKMCGAAQAASNAMVQKDLAAKHAKLFD